MRAFIESINPVVHRDNIIGDIKMGEIIDWEVGSDNRIVYKAGNSDDEVKFSLDCNLLDKRIYVIATIFDGNQTSEQIKIALDALKEVLLGHFSLVLNYNI